MPHYTKIQKTARMSFFQTISIEIEVNVDKTKTENIKLKTYSIVVTDLTQSRN